VAIGEDVIYLQKKYHTTSPFEMAKAMGTILLFEDLGSINGYYNKFLRIKQIHINSNLDSHLKRFTCAHELGHSIYHPDANTPFLRDCTFMSTNRLEIEANTFAMYFLITNDDLVECQCDTTNQLARYFGYTKEMIELRLKGGPS